MKRAAALLLAVLLAACARTGPPAPVFNYGLQTRENMTALVRQQSPLPSRPASRQAKPHTPPTISGRSVPASKTKQQAAGKTHFYQRSAQGTMVPSPPPKVEVRRPVPETLVHEAAVKGKFIWPVHGRTVSAYGAKPGGLYNDGVNIAAPRGTAVLAASEGTIAYVGNKLGGYGNLVLIRHGGGMMTAYAHLGLVTVKQGAHVKKGQAIGGVGATGGVPSPQLHFEIREDGDAVNPEKYL
jgi:murein DD-endopeptidase MepM/ murein hydrolase activator NlpD